jgi:hypothetical protein
MKPIKGSELYQHLGEFLKSRGIEFKDGSYPRKIQKSCGLLADAINLGQKGIESARKGIDRTVEQLRKTIHEKTAPKPPVIKPQPGERAACKPAPARAAAGTKRKPSAGKAAATKKTPRSSQ